MEEERTRKEKGSKEIKSFERPNKKNRRTKEERMTAEGKKTRNNRRGKKKRTKNRSRAAEKKARKAEEIGEIERKKESVLWFAATYINIYICHKGGERKRERER